MGAWPLAVVCTVLLVSYGGAIVAAPVTVPLLFFAARSSPGNGYRIYAGIVVALTIAETGWALTYLAVGESAPLIWLAPSAAVVVGAISYARWSRPSTEVERMRVAR